jgi:PilZ domain
LLPIIRKDLLREHFGVGIDNGARPENIAPGKNVSYPENAGMETAHATALVELRRRPRFKLEVEVIIHSHSEGVLKGRTVDISESGIAAMVKVEVPLNELVQLDFKLPEGSVEIEALVRQRNAFRYGFQFVEQGTPREFIARACRRMARDLASST